MLDIPLDGPPVSAFPRLQHRCGLSGLVLHALPPGHVSIRYRCDTHLFDVNQRETRGRFAIDSDRVRPFAHPVESVALYPAGSDFRLGVHNADWGALIEIAPDRLSGLFEEVLDAAAPDLRFTGYRPHARAATLGRMLSDHLRTGRVNPLYAEGLALAVVGLTLESALDLAAPAVAGTEPRIARAVEHIEAHLGDVASIAEIAAVVCMSPSHFARAFRAAMGEAPWAYVLRRRTERAVRRIRLTRAPLSAIAVDCGFADADAMARAVRRHAGVPPSALRGDA